MAKIQKIDVMERMVAVQKLHQDDYISITDIARHRDQERSDYIIQNWMRNRNTIEFLGIWEQLNNPDFNSIEFDGIRNQAGLNSFSLTPKRWISSTGAIGIVAKTGRYGGTFAHKDIAFEFASWVSVEFKLYLIKEFQRLKEDEHKQLGWDIRRNLAKINYRIHTDAVQANLIPPELTPQQISFVYANEADVLNMALFGMTAKQWRENHSDDKGNIRDHANAAQLVCLANLESLNALFIADGVAREERLMKLNQTAIQQMKILLDDSGVKRLK
ncbi:KilA-N domain-containing protein [Tichowtungia aerotolerans]|uniref:KilA-N domain-containing protein n=1 Tax=Tichowtungia aerotolerans TaxID=2697043 RepID=A0A6P1M4P0_9BACT|nr:KilA-N domain-containing protein [Tichowtungia aerotolerans]QHI68811.1 KilA-N domain-containing protein [Tichowtungia aerotolerans]